MTMSAICFQSLPVTVNPLMGEIVSTPKPIVGIFAPGSSGLSLYKTVVLPALSNPSMRILHEAFPDIKSENTLIALLTIVPISVF